MPEKMRCMAVVGAWLMGTRWMADPRAGAQGVSPVAQRTQCAAPGKRQLAPPLAGGDRAEGLVRHPTLHGGNDVIAIGFRQ